MLYKSCFFFQWLIGLWRVLTLKTSHVHQMSFSDARNFKFTWIARILSDASSRVLLESSRIFPWEQGVCDCTNYQVSLTKYIAHISCAACQGKSRGVNKYCRDHWLTEWQHVRYVSRKTVDGEKRKLGLTFVFFKF